jgi:hypothetical protein
LFKGHGDKENDRSGNTAIMTELIEAAAAFLLMLLSAFVGWAAQRALSDDHRSRDSIDAIRLVITMLVTFSALVLGLLTSSAKSRFDEESEALSTFGVSLIELDQRLREFGPDASPLRESLRRYVAGAIVDTWPTEQPPDGAYPRFPPSAPDAAENRSLGAILDDIEAKIDVLQPNDAKQRTVGPRLQRQMQQVLDLRWRLVASIVSTISRPFLAMLMFWMVIIFAAFGLTSPRNPTLYITLLLGALLIASSLYLILDYDSPQSGFIHLSSLPLRNALAHIDAPN